MFTTDIETLRKYIHLLRRTKCSYDGMMFEKEPSTCDCKYGIDLSPEGAEQRRFGGEQTGCPELRNIEINLNNITQDEFNEIANRPLKRYAEEVERMKKKDPEAYKKHWDAMHPFSKKSEPYFG
jgi:hypothetical protein